MTNIQIIVLQQTASGVSGRIASLNWSEIGPRPTVGNEQGIGLSGRVRKRPA